MEAPMSRVIGSSFGGSNEVFRFALHVLKGRWVSLISCLLIMACNGGTYIFGIYSQEIKTSMGYDQSTLNLIGFFKDLGANIGVISGLIAEVVPTWSLLIIGSILNLGGYLAIWLAVAGKIAKPKVWQMCLYICMGANSQNFANTGVLVTSVRNFPENRGNLLGLLKGFAGLSGAIMTQTYLAVYGNDPKSLILLLGWLPAALAVLCVYAIREMEVARQPNQLRVLYQFLVVSISLALFLMAMTIVQGFVNFSQAVCVVIVLVIGFMFFLLLLIAIREELVLWNQKKYSTSPMQSTTEKPLARESLPQINEEPKVSCISNIMNKPTRGEDYSILQALISLDMLLLLFSAMCGIGSNLTAIDNLGQIGESKGYPTKTIKSFVSLVSIWNFFGRIVGGFASEKLLAKYKLPRPLVTAGVLFLSCFGLIIIAFPIPGSVYVASVIIGFSFGAQFPLLSAIISELFGLKHFSTLFNCGQLASPIGSFILNVKVTGILYDREASKELARKGIHRSSVNELTCIGARCYRLSFIILAIVTFVGALASLALAVRTRDFYRSDIYKKFRVEAEAHDREMYTPMEETHTKPEDKEQAIKV